MARKGSEGAASDVVDRWAMQGEPGAELYFSSDNALQGGADRQ